MFLAPKNCMNVCPGPQELYNSKHMDMSPTRRDCITYTVPCIPYSNGLEKCVETLDSVSNYYKESYMYHNKSTCKLSKGGLHHAFSSIPETNSIPQHHKNKGLITWCTCNMICETLPSVYWLMYSLFAIQSCFLGM